MSRAGRLSLLTLACGLLTTAAGAEVRDRAPSGFTVRTTVSVVAPPQRVYQDLLDLGSWWDSEHTYSGDAKNMTLAAQPGGCFCEKVPGGGAVEHGRVINVSTGRMIRISAAVGPLQELAVTGTMTWQIEPSAQGKGSTLTMTYTAAGYAPGGLDKLADIVDQVLGRQVQLLKAHSEKSR